MTSFRRKLLGEILSVKGVVSQEQINELLKKTDGRRVRIGERLIEEGLLTEELLAQALAEQRDLRFLDLADFRVDQAFLKTISVDLMHRRQFIPVEDRGDVLVVAVADPNDLPAIDELEMVLDRPLEIAVSAPSAIREVLTRSGGSEPAAPAARDLSFSPVREQEDVPAAGPAPPDSLAADDGRTTQLLHAVVSEAVRRGASDIHIEAADKDVTVKFRINGVLHPAPAAFDLKSRDAVVSQIKALSGLDPAVQRAPQEGRFTLATGGKTFDVRASILPSVSGEDVALRVIDRRSAARGRDMPGIDGIGLNENDLRTFRKSIHEPYGMVVVAGPAESGKTATLYAVVKELSSGENKFVAIEDPVEYSMPGVVQVQVNEKEGLGFARGLRAILRHDADKIVIGELRDAETARLAAQTALTGRPIFTTMPASDAFDAVARLLNMGIEPYTLVSSLNCVLAQRLIRVLCPRCKKPVRPSRSELENSALDYEQYKEGRFHEAGGCRECSYTGFQGRKAVAEILVLSDRIREKILEKRPSSEVRNAAISEGMTTLRRSALAEVLSGTTTLKEINRVTFIE
jgi:type IV pilus assembly protein PilB